MFESPKPQQEKLQQPFKHSNRIWLEDIGKRPIWVILCWDVYSPIPCQTQLAHKCPRCPPSRKQWPQMDVSKGTKKSLRCLPSFLNSRNSVYRKWSLARTCGHVVIWTWKSVQPSSWSDNNPMTHCIFSEKDSQTTSWRRIGTLRLPPQ